MTLAEKKAEILEKKNQILKAAKKATKKLEADFQKQIGKSKKTTTQEVLTYRGRYYAIVGPLLKEAKKLDDVLALL